MLKIIASDFEIRTINIECSHHKHQTLISSSHEPNFFCNASLWNIVLLFNQRLSELSHIFRGVNMCIHTPFNISQRCSMGDMSSDKAGQSSTSIPLFAMEMRVTFAVWGRAPSCCRIPPFLGKCRLKIGKATCLKTFWYTHLQ